jgi:hypothetical protein
VKSRRILTYFYSTNQAPTVTMSWPWSTSAASPNVTNEQRPTLSWVQNDPDPGAVFEWFQLQITEQGGAVVLDTGVLQMSTSANEASWKVLRDLPLGKPLAVRVQVWDQYGAGSGWSESTWLYVNRAPVAAFDWVPKPAYEGDEVQLTNRSTDPDGDALQAEWRIAGPAYDETGAVWNAVIPAVRTDGHPGDWVVTLTVTDVHGLTGTVTQIVPIGDLTLQGFVKHTERWEENRRKYNLRQTGDVELPRTADKFWAGESFVLEAATNQPASGVEARMSHLELMSTLAGDGGKTGWSSSLYRDDFELLPDGPYTFMFTARFPNGHIEAAAVIVHIQGAWTEYTSSVRKE